MILKIVRVIIFSVLLLQSCKTKDKIIIVEGGDDTMLIKNINEDRHSNPLYREFRAAWFSTVVNIDWPILGGSEDAQKRVIRSHFDKLVEHNFNAVFVQVKPDAGVIYPSRVNPTTRYFWGTRATNERDDYPFETDLLEYIIEEAHKRNLEIHAWINPYRLSVTHDTKMDLDKQFAQKNFLHKYIAAGNTPIYWPDGRIYLDPGEPMSADYVIESVIEILENYDVDGIHFDDYFYQNAAGGKTFKDWPDQVSATKYAKKQGYNPDDKEYDDYGRSGLFAWRRQNVNSLISRMYVEIKKRKPYVKWTISPAGIWRNQKPLTYIPGDENGSDTRGWGVNFDALHADVLLWLLNGQKNEATKNAGKLDGFGKRYVDAIIPQVYWSSSNQAAPFNIVVDWWIDQTKGTDKNKTADLYIGHALYRMGSSTNTEPWQTIETMSEQIEYIRKQGEGIISGSAFFTLHNMYLNDRDTKDFGAMAMSNILVNQYIFPAIVPTMKTINLRSTPNKPVNIKADIEGEEVVISWQDTSNYRLDKYKHPIQKTSVYYAIYREKVGNVGIELIAKVRRIDTDKNATNSYRYKHTGIGEYFYYVTAIDRLHNESASVKSRILKL